MPTAASDGAIGRCGRGGDRVISFLVGTLRWERLGAAHSGTASQTWAVLLHSGDNVLRLTIEQNSPPTSGGEMCCSCLPISLGRCEGSNDVPVGALGIRTWGIGTIWTWVETQGLGERERACTGFTPGGGSLAWVTSLTSTLVAEGAATAQGTAACWANATWEPRAFVMYHRSLTCGRRGRPTTGSAFGLGWSMWARHAITTSRPTNLYSGSETSKGVGVHTWHLPMS